MGPCRHVTVAGAVALGALSAAGLWVGEARGEANPSREATLAALHRCFVQQVRQHHRSRPVDDANALPYDPAPLGPSSEIFFFDQLAAAERQMGGPARLLWCRPWFSGPYTRAHGVLSRRSRVARHAAAPNAPERHHFSHHNDATRVLRAAAHAGGEHPLAELAHVVLEALGEAGGGPDEADADWLAVTALLPELYLYDAPQAHAYTPDSGRAPGAADVERARRRFVAYVRAGIGRARAAEAQGHHEAALLHLGAAAHALWDLHVHRGMTEREHAGLVYARHLPVELGPASRDPAVRGALVRLFEAVWPQGPRTPVRWRERAADGRAPAPRTRRLVALLTEQDRSARPVDFAALRARWLSAYTYAPAGESVADDDVLRAASAGRWDVDRSLAEIWREDGG